MNRLAPSVFTARGIVAIGYAGFAFALGIATSTLTRRTLPAMAATLLTFIAARSVITLWVRPHLLQRQGSPGFGRLRAGRRVCVERVGCQRRPERAVPIPNAWILSTALVDPARHALSASTAARSADPRLPGDRGRPPAARGQPPEGPAWPSDRPHPRLRAKALAPGPPARHLPAIKPLLAAASARGRDLPRRRGRSHRRRDLARRPARRTQARRHQAAQ